MVIEKNRRQIMNVFDIICQIMIGPSISHTAGAVRLGQIATAIFGYAVKEANITLYGSFAKTHKGHGTDKAIIGGILGMKVDDAGIKTAIQAAAQAGLVVTFTTDSAKGYHPNTVKIQLKDKDSNEVTVMGSSIGGGNVRVSRINDLKVSFTCEYHTLIISHYDREGAVAQVANLLATSHINIAQMKLYRYDKGGEAVMVIEVDQKIGTHIMEEIKGYELVKSVATVKAI
jgi:L-serine dehydratase